MQILIIFYRFEPEEKRLRVANRIVAEIQRNPVLSRPTVYFSESAGMNTIFKFTVFHTKHPFPLILLRVISRLAIMVSVLETGLPGIAHTAGSDRRFSTYWLSGFGLISDWMVGALYLLWEIGSMHLSVEGLRPWDWSYPVLQYLREWPTPTVVSSLSRVLSLNTNQPTNPADSLTLLSSRWFPCIPLFPPRCCSSVFPMRLSFRSNEEVKRCIIFHAISLPS